MAAFKKRWTNRRRCKAMKRDRTRQARLREVVTASNLTTAAPVNGSTNFTQSVGLDIERTTACNCPMPLFGRHVADHYPDRENPHSDHYVVLCGSLECGGFHRLAV